MPVADCGVNSMSGGQYGPGCPKDCPRRSISPNCHNPETCETWAKYLERKAAAKAAREAVRKAERDLEGMQVRRSTMAAKEARRHKCRN